MLIGANLILNDTTLAMCDVAPLVEAHGLDALFIGEHTHMPVATRHPEYPDRLPEFYKRFLDPFVQLAVAAAVTDHIRIGTGVILVAERNPLELAKAVASLDVISNGRVEFGVGYGWNPLEMRNNGIEPSTRRAVFREKLRAIRRLWTEDSVAFVGDHVRFSESWSFPKPVQRPHPPIFIGCSATEQNFEDVVTLGDGWAPLGAAALPEQLARLALRSGGVLPCVSVVEMEGQRPGKPWYVDSGRALKVLGEKARMYADAGVYRLTIGVPADSRDRLERSCECLTTIGKAVA